MIQENRKTKFYLFSFPKHDFGARITVFFTLLVCLDMSLASRASVNNNISICHLKDIPDVETIELH